MDDTQLSGDLTRVLYTKEEVGARMTELAAQIDRDYAGKDLLLVGVLNGAVMVMADLSRALAIHCRMDWMAVSSYGSGTSAGEVRMREGAPAELTPLLTSSPQSALGMPMVPASATALWVKRTASTSAG